MTGPADHEYASRLGGSHSSTWQRTTIPSKPALGFGGTRNVWRWGEDRSSGRSARIPAGQRGDLLHLGRHLRLVKIVLVDVDPARVLARASGWNGSQRRASEEGHLDVVGEDVERQKPALALHAVKGRVPFHGFAHAGHVAHDERVEALPEVALPARHRGHVRPYRSIAVGLRDLRIAA